MTWRCNCVCRIVIYLEQQYLFTRFSLECPKGLMATYWKHSQHAVAVSSNLRRYTNPNPSIPQCQIFNASTNIRKPGIASMRATYLIIGILFLSHTTQPQDSGSSQETTYLLEKNSKISCTPCRLYIFGSYTESTFMHRLSKTYSAYTRTTITSVFVTSPQLS